MHAAIAFLEGGGTDDGLCPNVSRAVLIEQFVKEGICKVIGGVILPCTA